MTRATDFRRFWCQFRVEESGCWTWTGHLDSCGYGRGANLIGERLIHRTTYRVFSGPIPAGLWIDHLCRNRACGNPAHLEAVAPLENLRRSPFTLATSNGRKTHCKHGHEFTPENTYIHREGRQRQCRTCVRATARARAQMGAAA